MRIWRFKTLTGRPNALNSKKWTMFGGKIYENSKLSKRRRLLLGGDNVDPGSGDGKRAPLYHCNYCHKDISGVIRIKCAKCPDFDMCIECFSVGAEVYPHKTNHPYRVVDNLAFPLISPEWNADEEVLLLEGVEMYGLGNWAEVSEQVGSKTKSQCYEHYMSAYMNSPVSPLLDTVHVMGKTKAELLAMAKVYSENKKSSGVPGETIKPLKQEPSISPARAKMEEVKEVAEGRSPSRLLLGVKDNKGEVEQGEGSSVVPMSAAKKAAGGIQMKQNLDGSGTLITEEGQSNRSIGGNKPKPLSEDVKAGGATLEQTGYNPKRQEFDPEYDNDAELPLADMEFKDNDTDTDRELKIRMLHIYLSRLEERKRCKEFIIERGLLNLKKLQALDRKRSKEERELYQRTRVFLRYHTTEEHEALLNGLETECRIRQKIEDLQEMRLAGCRTLAEGDLYISEKKRKESEMNIRKSRDNILVPLSGKGPQRSNRYIKREEDHSPSGNSKEILKACGSALQGSLGDSTGGKSMKRSVGSELAGYPGTELLSLTEQELCLQCKLKPGHYLKMKDVLVTQSFRKGQVKRADAYSMFKVEPIKTDRVYEFLIGMGWIHGDGPAFDRKTGLV